MIAIEDQVATKEETLTRLYKEAFPSVAKFVHKNGGSFDDAKDIFQEALIIYYENEQPVEQTNAYLFGIARHLWYRKHNDQKYEAPLDEKMAEQIESIQEPHPSSEKLLGFLMHAGQKCMEMLKAFYYDKLSMSKLSTQFGFGSERSATVQKYKCLEKVRDQIKSKNMTYEDFLE